MQEQVKYSVISHSMEINVHAFGIITLLTRGKAITKLDIPVQMSITKFCFYLCHHKLCCHHIMMSPTLTLQAVILKTISKLF